MDSELRRIHEELQIPSDYGVVTGLSEQATPADLVSIGRDIYGRPQQLRHVAAEAWRGMKSHAQLDGVDIQVVSAYRSVHYQVDLIRRHLRRGDTIDQILSRVAAPGYSEHQSGCALDLTAPGYEAVEEEFELSDAFEWLTEHAARHRFVLSYPRSNRYGVIYEPWHWCYRIKEQR